MAGPQEQTPEARLAAARAHVAREMRRARRALLVERAIRVFWPLWAVLALFLGLALLGLPQRLPLWQHWALLVGFAAALGWTGWAGWRALTLPDEADGRLRLDDGTADRPVSALDDALALGPEDPATQSIWLAHQARMAERAAAARAAAADLRVSAQDRFALRHAALLALAAGVIAQIGDGGTRLADALVPSAASRSAVGAVVPSLEAWASPPVHTRVAPLYLTERSGEALTLPETTEVTLRVFDAGAEPEIVGAEGAFEEQDGGVWTAKVTLDEDGPLTARLGDETLGTWDFALIPDDAPTIRFTEEPGAARSGALEFAFEAADDYGIVSARAEIRLDDTAPIRDVDARTVFEPIVFDLPLPLARSASSAAETVLQDLTDHPWGGLPVVLTIIAEDGAGQEGRDERRLALPQRPFFEPLARAVIEERRSLAWSLDGAPRVHRVLEAVTAHPDDIFRDVTAFMTLRTAIRRLDYALIEETVDAEAEGIVELLWLAALRIEDGDLSAAEQRLRQIQRELSDAIERGAEPDEISRLMEELRQAMNEYLQQLAQEAMRNPPDEDSAQQQVDPDQMITQQDLEDLLAQIEEMLRSGMFEEARQMLQMLQQMMENLQMAQPGQGQPGEGQGDQALQQLQDMMGQQQGLADRSFDALRQGQEQGDQPGQQGQGQPGQGQPGQGQQGQGQSGQGQSGQQPGDGMADGGQGGGRPGDGPDLGGIARDQEALRRMLDDLRGNLPGEGGRDALDRAEESMGAARDALEGGDADGALQNQVDALDALREGARDLAQELAEGQPGDGQQAGRDGRAGNVRDEDPLGRPRASDGPLDGDSVRVPDASVMQRARELMDEIRRRAGERTRPQLELDYLERLLDRF